MIWFCPQLQWHQSICHGSGWNHGSVTNFTIAAWVNWNGGGAWQRIFDFGNDTTQYMFLTPSSGSSTLRFAISTNGNVAGAEQILETAPLPVGQWRHVAVTRNGNTTHLYSNGVLAVSGSVTIAPANFNRVGRVSLNVAPLQFSLAPTSRPPWAAIIDWQIASPKPSPFGFVV